jgi:Protein of unknown function (DUF2420)
MTSVAPLHLSNMDLLRTEDKMDLASSPATRNDDVDFELDDFRGASVEPNQDLMLEDEPEQPMIQLDPMRTTTGEQADDDLMVDEDTVIHHEPEADLPDLSMDSRQDERRHVEEDDDILYEDEEDLQPQDEGSLESSKQEEIDHGSHVHQIQLTQEVPISDGLLDESEVHVNQGLHTDGEANEGEETEHAWQHPSTESTEQPDNTEDILASGEVLNGDSYLEQGKEAAHAEEIDGNQQHKQEEARSRYQNGPQTDDYDSDRPTDPTHLDHPESNDLEAPAQFEEPLHLDSGAQLYTEEDTNHEGPASPGVDHTPALHAVKVQYLESEMCLFPPIEGDDSEMFFLQDVSLAHESLDKMLEACRDVLADTIGDDDELVLDVASLGLHISEVSCIQH